VLFALLAALTLGQTPHHRLAQQPNLAHGSLALFEFAPASGLGMGAACACATPTGAKGEVVTFTRASSATCLKGNTTTGIQNGDMVTCGTNQARVMPGGDGSGGLGLLSERSRTNIALRSQEFDNAAVWVPASSVCGAITITANAATAPDNTLTAERVQIPACASGFSLIQQTGLGAAGTYSEFVYAKGNGQSGSFIIDLGNTSCLACSYVPGSWTQCKQQGRVLGAATVFSIGEDITDCGGGATASQDFFLWGGQMELGSFSSSYIATAGTAATRTADLAFATVSFPGATGWSLAATWLSPSTIVGDPFAAEASDGTGNNRYDLWGNTGSTMATLVRVGGVDFTGPSVAASAGTAIRAAAYYDGANQATCVNGACTTSAKSYTPFTVTRIVIGNFAGGSDEADGVVKQVCYDTNISRCR
jgi:hypothetical protein